MKLGLPPEVEGVLRRFLSCEVSTLARDGTPITWPTAPVWEPEPRRFLITTSIGLPDEAFNVRRDPRASLLFSDPTGSGLASPPAVLVQGHAEVTEKISTGEDIEHYWLDAEGEPFSVRCIHTLDSEGELLRSSRARRPPFTGPASLLCHRHDEELWRLRSFLVRGSLEVTSDAWVFRPRKFVPGAGVGDGSPPCVLCSPSGGAPPGTCRLGGSTDRRSVGTASWPPRSAQLEHARAEFTFRPAGHIGPQASRRLLSTLRQR